MKEPYGWVIEHGRDHRGLPRCSFFRNDGIHDQPYVEQKAADLRGVWFPVYTERRKDQ